MRNADYNIQAADNVAKQKIRDRPTVMFRKSSQEIWDEIWLDANRSRTGTQRRYAEKYGERYAVCPGSSGVGCVFFKRDENEKVIYEE